MENRWSKEFQEAYEKALENAEKHPENYNDIFAGYENDLQKALSLIEWQEDHIKRLEAQSEFILRRVSNKDFPISNEAEYLLNSLGYRKMSANAVELPCKAGDLVHFKGLDTPWRVSAIHIYEEGQPQIAITTESRKITSTMTVDEFNMFCTVISDAMKEGGE